MSKGGRRPGAGRPKKALSGHSPAAIVPAPGEPTAPATRYDNPLDYVRALMNDAGADHRRRDWAAGVLAMYLHPKPAPVATATPRQQAHRAAMKGERELRDDFDA